MLYKIVITKFKTGRTTYQAYIQRKQWGIFNYWSGLTYDASEHSWATDCESREKALRLIDSHYKGNQVVDTVEVEYITK